MPSFSGSIQDTGTDGNPSGIGPSSNIAPNFKKSQRAEIMQQCQLFPFKKT